ncbi:MAG: minor capsid protein [Sphingomonas sp.]|uniref:phage head morphogenesis protein n=1 Tax=Sphingomonas sp. TaxID=28214 RepID=UPI0025EE3ABD|nr:phage minor head protein [Sphingomonas sp.]MBX9881229.1 minor capsid protein [Sphingomonas sp.]
MANPSIRQVITLPPVDTVRAFEARDRLRATVNWTDMWQAEHARSFTVAKLLDLDILAEIQAAVADVIANGGTFEQFRANLEPYLRSKGWWGAVSDPGLTGTAQAVNIGPARLRTIYDTNLRVSRAAGRWKRIQELKGERPFLRYVAVRDRRTRPLHREWHGTILPVDDPWWDTHYPPCGWYCRCTVRQLSQRDLDREGWKVSPRPALDPVPFIRPGTGEVIQVPKGIDPGFGYNAGMASMAAIMRKAQASLANAAPLDLAAARATLNDIVQSDAFLEALQEPGAVVPVMVLAPDLQAAIAADTPIVLFSADSYRKQLGETKRSRGHGELTIADYRRLPEVGAAPDLVLQEDDQRLLLFKLAEDDWLVAVIKATKDRRETYLQSYRHTNAADVARLQRKNREVPRG